MTSSSSAFVPACLGSRSSARTSCLAIFLLLLSSSCIGTSKLENPPSPRTEDAASPDLESTNSATVADLRAATRLVVEFSVHRYTAPRGVFSSKDAHVWKVATGPLPSATMSLLLADCGFRAMVGTESDRRALAEAMNTLRDSTDLRSVLDQIMPDAAREIEIEIGPVSWPRLSVFFVDRDGNLAGQDFQDAKVKFLMNFAMRPENLREVWVQLVPAIEEPPGPLRWIGTPDGGFQQLPELRRRVFSEVALTAPIPEGGFLLLGPTEIVYDRPYLARPFFVEQTEGGEKKLETRESLYIISPILHTVREGFSDRRRDAAPAASR